MKAALFAPLLVLFLAGCAAGPNAASSPPASTATPASTGTPTATPTPTPTETETPDAAAATCESLLDPASVKRGQAAGGELHTFTAEEAEDGGTLKKVLDYGGVACSFGQSGGDSPVLYGYGPITDAQAKKQIAHLKKLGGPTGTNENGGTYFGAADDTEIYVFSPKGYWAYQYNNGFGNVADIDAIEEVVAHAPEFY